MAQAIFGPGNTGVTNQQISQFLATPGLTPDQIINAMNSSGVSLAQAQAAAPGDSRLSNQTALPYLAGIGITPPVTTTQTPVSGAPQTGLIGSEAALSGALTGSLDALQQGNAQANQVLQQGISALDPFVNSGNAAIGQQAALSGALGNDAQKQSFANFNSSPGQEFLQQRGEQAVLRNASATGGLGGSRVLQELQRQGIGFAQQDFQNHFDRLGQVSNMGLGGLNIASNLTGQMANNNITYGNNAANFAFNTGQSVAGGRTRAGEMLANLNNQQGSGISDIINQGGSNLAQLLAGSGESSANGQMTLAQLLASLGMQQSGQVAGLGGVPGVQYTPGAIQGIGQLASGLGGAAMAFK